MTTTFRLGSIAALLLGLALAASATQAGALFAGGKSVLNLSVGSASVVEPAVVVVRRRAVAGRPVARCVWVRGRRVC
jgi:hypothetical protein